MTTRREFLVIAAGTTLMVLTFSLKQYHLLDEIG